MSSRSQASNRLEQPSGAGDALWLWVGIAVVATSLGAVYGAVHLGYRLAGQTGSDNPPDNPPADPWAVLFGVLDGSVKWLPECTTVLVALAVVLCVLVLTGAWLVGRRRRRGSRVDWTSNYLGRGREVENISAPAARKTAERLGVTSRLPGLPIGRTLSSTGGSGSSGKRKYLYSSWEDMQVLVAGPRTGKSVSFAIPAILDAPGAVLVTSNKRDIVDATRDVRAAQHAAQHAETGRGHGGVFVFDPQGIAGEEATWWWNPLSYVTDEVKAANLARHFASAQQGPQATSGDDYFENAGHELLSDLLLAAALDGRPITDVFRWLTRPDDDTAAKILHAHDYDLLGDRLLGKIEAAPKERSGIYGTGRQMASCLTNRAVLRWVTDAPDPTSARASAPTPAPSSALTSSSVPRRRHFDAAAFVADGGTLYSLSKEGEGTAGALVTALTVAVVEAAEALATTQPGGRLATPLVGVLDEAANVCRWRALPDLYSHYGSRGIVLSTILQSWSQGVDVWGKSGMNKLWSAANVAIYAGGVKEVEFLQMLAELIGSYDKITRSVSTRPGGGLLDASGTQVSRQLSRERIFEVDDLAALPKGRAVVLSSGNRPVLVATVPWMRGPHEDAVNASIKAHDPQAARTIDHSYGELRTVEADPAHASTIEELR